MAAKKPMTLLRAAEMYAKFVVEFSFVGVFWVAAGAFISKDEQIVDSISFLIGSCVVYAALWSYRKMSGHV